MYRQVRMTKELYQQVCIDLLTNIDEMTKLKNILTYEAVINLKVSLEKCQRNFTKLCELIERKYETQIKSLGYDNY